MKQLNSFLHGRHADKFRERISELQCNTAEFVRAAVIHALDNNISFELPRHKKLKEKHRTHLTEAIVKEMGITFPNEHDPKAYYVLDEKKEAQWRRARAKVIAKRKMRD